MNSWKLLAHLTPFWESDAITPVFMREVALPSIWRAAVRYLGRIAGPLLIALVCLALLAALRAPLRLATQCFSGALYLLVLLLPSLFAWAVPLGLALGPTIVGERERQSWETLRATPLDTEALLLSKARGALWRLRGPLYAQRLVLIVASFGVGVIGLSAIGATGGAQAVHVPPYAACGGAVAIIALGAGLYLLDRAQQFALMAAAALGASASTLSLRAALASAIGAASGVWLADVSLALLALTLQPAHAQSLAARLVILTMFGPTAAYLIELPPARAALSIALTLIARELAVRAAWRWTVHAASAP